jgi:colicin import membrane protein
VAKANAPTRFDIKRLEAAQKAHDRVAAAEAQRKAEVARVERQRAEAAAAQKAALAKAQADAAAKQAELQAQIAREKARAEAERQAAVKRQEELVLRTRPIIVHHDNGGGCVLC